MNCPDEQKEKVCPAGCYKVTIVEEIVEHRDIYIPIKDVSNLQEAAEAAFHGWVSGGEFDSGPRIDVKERYYEIDGVAYYVDDDH